MSYNIFSVTKPAMPKVPKTAKIIDLVLKNVSFDMHNPSFRCLSPYFRAEFLTQNLSIQTTELRIYVAKWHVWLPIRG